MRRPTWPLVAAVVALVVAAGSAAALLRQGRDLDEPIVSVALGGRVHARVILPASYDDRPHRRYPVVYFLHGLPSGASAYRSNGWLAEALRSAGEAILVFPQGARDNDTDPEYLDWGAGRNWQTYIATRVAAHDRRTLPHDPLALRPCDRRPLGRRLRRHGRRPAPHGHLLGDRVVVGLLPPDRPDRDEAARPRAAGERPPARQRRCVAAGRISRSTPGAATCGSRTRTSRSTGS